MLAFPITSYFVTICCFSGIFMTLVLVNVSLFLYYIKAHRKLDLLPCCVDNTDSRTRLKQISLISELTPVYLGCLFNILNTKFVSFFIFFTRVSRFYSSHGYCFVVSSRLNRYSFKINRYHNNVTD